MKRSVDVVLVHGWGVNSGVWDEFIEYAALATPELNFITACLPGYGNNEGIDFPNSIEEVAQIVLDEAPDNAVWLGWSLGGMVAIQAAVMNKDKNIRGLYLMATSPCFTSVSGWDCGVPIEVFERFSQELAGDYKSALSMFLLLQAGSNLESRKLAMRVQNRIYRYPDPSEETLKAGIACLKNADLRPLLRSEKLKKIPTHVLSCSRDRVANPAGGEKLAAMLASSITILNSGHAPFLSCPEKVAGDLQNFCERIF